MLDKNHFKDLITYVLIICLFILAIIVIYPVIKSIIYGVLLGYIFFPIYRWALKRLKNETFTAIVVCLGASISIIVILTLIITSFFQQVVEFYLTLQGIDLTALLSQLLPKSVSSTEIYSGLVASISTSVSTLISGYFAEITKLILNLPSVLLQIFVVVFIFFFALKDGERAISYMKTLSPMKKETEEKFFKQFKDITNSVLVGQVVIGILQGIIAGIGYFIFGVPNALLMTIITTLVGVIPVIGPWLVWVPIDIYLFAIGRSGAGIGLLIYGAVLINWIDALLRPVIVSRKTKINSGIVLIGMIGGLFVFGIIGLIIGPLILSYVLLVMELYRKKDFKDKSIIFLK